MPVKLNDNTQFARVANADGSSPLGAAAINDGLAPLCNDQGHLIVTNGGASINFALSRTSNTDGSSPAGALAPGTLQPQLVDAHGRPITSNLTANADGTNPNGAAAPDTMQVPLLDAHGRTITVPYVGGSILSGAPTFDDSQAVTLWRVVSAVACKLYQAFGSHAEGSLLWLHLFNLNAGPPGGAVVPRCAALPVQTGGMWSHSFPEGLSFSTGLVIAYSTTQATYTAPTTGGWISSFYR